jgi:hypothetical protein
MYTVSLYNGMWFGGWDSAVGIVTGYRLDERGVRVQVLVGPRIFSSPCCSDRFWGHPASYPTGTGALSTGVKRPGREADHSPPISAKKMWIYPLPPMPSWCSA